MKRILFSCTALLLSTQLYANPHSFNLLNHSFYSLVSLGVGAGFPISQGPDKDFPIINPLSDEFYRYHGDRNRSVNTVFNLFLGGETSIAPNTLLQAGMSAYRAPIYTVKGSFWQGADVASANRYLYSYHIDNFQIAAEAKLLYTYNIIYHPYILGNLGIAVNDAKDYRTSVPPFLTFTREYRDRRLTGFSYAVGLGVDMEVNTCYRIGISYRLRNLGRQALGSAHIDGVPVSGHLGQHYFWVNDFWVQGTVLL